MTGRYLFLYGVYLALFLLVLVLICRIQFKYHDVWLAAFEDFKKAPAQLTEVAPRGNIYSADGQLLATSMPLYRVYMDMHTPAQDSIWNKKADCVLMEEQADSLALGLHRLFGEKTTEEYKQLLLTNFHTKPRGYHHVSLCSRAINYVELQQLQKLPILRLRPMQGGLIVEPIYRRTHPYGMLAERTIGNVYAVEQKAGSEDVTGGSGHYGLERSFEDVLRGENGTFINQSIDYKRIRTVTKESTAGKDIVTTLDTHLQDIVESVLQHAVDSLQPDWGCAVLMETKTGHIKAIANLGMLQDSVHYAEIENYAMNRALEPGSTFKPIALMATLDAGYASITDRVAIPGSGVWNYNPKNPEERIVDDEGGLGNLTLHDVIAASSNIGMAKTVTKYWAQDPRGFVRKLKQIGIVDSINSDLIGVAKPRLQVPQHFSELARMGYGYYVELPIIYSLMWYNGVANGGRMMRPMLVTDIRENGQVVKHYEPEVVVQAMCKPETLSAIREALHGVVWDSAHNTAKRARSEYVTIAGKTGTAQIQEHGYAKNRHRGSFVGFFPYDKPEYTCMVVIHNPRHGLDFGGYVAAPLVREIAERTMAAKSAQPIAVSQVKGGQQRQLPVKRDVHDCHAVRGQVPDVRGMGARDAVYLLEHAGLQARVEGVGQVVRQSIPAGTPTQKGQIVTIKLQ